MKTIKQILMCCTIAAATVFTIALIWDAYGAVRIAASAGIACFFAILTLCLFETEGY
jgi:hypothetical protein